MGNGKKIMPLVVFVVQYVVVSVSMHVSGETRLMINIEVKFRYICLISG